MSVSKKHIQNVIVFILVILCLLIFAKVNNTLQSNSNVSAYKQINHTAQTSLTLSREPIDVDSINALASSREYIDKGLTTGVASSREYIDNQSANTVASSREYIDNNPES